MLKPSPGATATLVVAAMAVGLMAGVFGLFAHAIMPGLGDTDDRTFVGAFQAIDDAIENPLFLPTFVGALVLTGLAALLHLRPGARLALPWIVAAFVLYLAAFVITIGVHLPLNDDIRAAGDPRPDRRPRGGARTLQRGQVGRLEHRPRGDVDSRARLPRLGTRATRARPAARHEALIAVYDLLLALHLLSAATALVTT